MATLNKIQIEDIRHRAEHCKGTNQDCKDLLQYIDQTINELACEGTLMEKISDNLSQYIDVDFDVTIDKRALAAFIKRNQ